MPFSSEILDFLWHREVERNDDLWPERRNCCSISPFANAHLSSSGHFPNRSSGEHIFKKNIFSTNSKKIREYIRNCVNPDIFQIAAQVREQKPEKWLPTWARPDGRTYGHRTDRHRMEKKQCKIAVILANSLKNMFFFEFSKRVSKNVIFSGNSRFFVASGGCTQWRLVARKEEPQFD